MINGPLLTPADLEALAPRKYLKLQQVMKDGRLKPVKVDAERVLVVYGGPQAAAEPGFQLELFKQPGKPTLSRYRGSTADVSAQFNALGLGKRLVQFDHVDNPLSHLPRTPLQDSFLQVSIINAIRRPPGYRTKHGYKVHSVIDRIDSPKPLSAGDEVAHLAERLEKLGYKAAAGSSMVHFILDPDQPGLKDVSGNRLPPVTPKRKPRKKNGSRDLPHNPRLL